MAERVHIREVGPRDGLQNEPGVVPVADRVHLIELLTAAGLEYIEAASFVSPQWVPQMAGGAEVMNQLIHCEGVTYAALVPNLRGYHEARLVDVDEVAIFASASESFSRAAIDCSIAESLARYREVCSQASADQVPVRGYVSCAIACPYEGPIGPTRVVDAAQALLAMGAREVSLADTIGVGAPDQVKRLLDVVARAVPADKIAMHFHDTHDRALSCIEAALPFGIRVFDSSIGSAGGCPYAPGARGNVATERVAAMLENAGYDTGIDHVALAEARSFMLQLLGRDS